MLINISKKMVNGARPSALQRLLLLLLFTSAATALVLLVQLPATTAAADSCAHYTHDALLDRLDTQLASCVDEQQHRAAVDTVKDRFATNEFDRQQPLALAAFSNSTQTLNAFAGAIASALFPSRFDALATRPSVQVLDLAQLMHVPGSHASTSLRNVKTALRHALATALNACPDRSLFILENVQALDDASLPALDAFLDPLNGQRAHFQQHAGDVVERHTGSSSTSSRETTRLLDSTRGVFLFLFHVNRSRFDAAATTASTEDTITTASIASVIGWRDVLMQLWTRREGLDEAFTPQALVGRLTDGITLFPTNDSVVRAPRACLVHKQSDHGNKSNSNAASASTLRLAWAAVPLLALLYRTKRWTQDVAVKRAARGPIRSKRSHSGKRSKRSGSSGSSSNSKKSRKRL